MPVIEDGFTADRLAAVNTTYSSINGYVAPNITALTLTG